MNDAAMGDIVVYTVTDDVAASDPAVTAGQTLPMIVVNVNEADGTVSGTAFLTDGTTRYVHVIPDEPEPEPEPEPDPETFDLGNSASLDAAVASLTDAQRDEMRTALALYPDAATVEDPTPPTATALSFSGPGNSTVSVPGPLNIGQTNQSAANPDPNAQV